MKKGIPVVNLEWSGDFPTFYCPVCGHPFWTEEDEPEVPCEHLLFSFIDEEPEISFHKKELAETFTAWARNDAAERGYAWHDSTDDVESYLMEELDMAFEERVNLVASLVDSSSAVCFTLTTCDFSCGPSSFTAVIAVDFARKSDKLPE